MTIRNWECKVQVHALTRVCTYSSIINPCTCTNLPPPPSPTVITGPPRTRLTGASPNGRSPHTDDRRTKSRANRPDRRLSPWAGPVTGEPGWQITTPPRRLAVAVRTILTRGTVHPHEKAEWQARLPEAVLTVAVIQADSATLWCRLGARPSLGVFHAGLRAVAGHARAQMLRVSIARPRAAATSPPQPARSTMWPTWPTAARPAWMAPKS
jgi:hypothetical protein